MIIYVIAVLFNFETNTTTLPVLKTNSSSCERLVNEI